MFDLLIDATIYYYCSSFFKNGIRNNLLPIFAVSELPPKF